MNSRFREMQVRKPKIGYRFLKLNKYSKIIAAQYTQDWTFIQLGDRSSGVFSNGVNKNKEDYGKGSLFVNILDVFREFTIDPRKLERVRLSNEEIANYKLEKGDIILCRSSNIFETVGYPVYFEDADEPVVYSGFTIRYRPNKEAWDQKFLTYTLMSYPIRKLVTSISTKSANSNVNQFSYKKIFVPRPPLQEQQKIASILSNVDSLIRQTQKIIEQIQRLKKSLMQGLLTKGIGHSKFKLAKSLFGKYEEIPEEWEIKTLDDLEVCSTSGGTPSREKTEYYEGNEIWIKSGELEDNFIHDSTEKISLEAIKNSSVKRFPKNTVLVAMYGATIGKTGILSVEGTTNQAVCAILPNSLFNEYFLQQFFIKNRKILISFGTGAGQPNINQDIIRKFLYMVPTLNEQQKIASILSNVDYQIQKQQEYKSRLETLKKGLMQKLLTGRIRVKA